MGLVKIIIYLKDIKTMAVVRVQTELNAKPNLVWITVLKYQTLVHIMKGLIRFSGKIPIDLSVGDKLFLRLWFFHIIPGWYHHLAIAEIDNTKRIIRSEESGGIVKKWNHIITVSELPTGGTLYCDEIEIEAGFFTTLVCLWAHFQYRYRQMRWRKLARKLSNGEQLEWLGS